MHSDTKVAHIVLVLEYSSRYIVVNYLVSATRLLAVLLAQLAQAAPQHSLGLAHVAEPRPAGRTVTMVTVTVTVANATIDGSRGVSCVAIILRQTQLVLQPRQQRIHLQMRRPFLALLRQQNTREHDRHRKIIHIQVIRSMGRKLQ